MHPDLPDLTNASMFNITIGFLCIGADRATEYHFFGSSVSQVHIVEIVFEDCSNVEAAPPSVTGSSCPLPEETHIFLFLVIGLGAVRHELVISCHVS